MRYLNHKEVEVRVGWKPPDYNVHDFDWTNGFDLNPTACIGHKVGKSVQRRRTHKVEPELIFIIIILAC